MADRIGGRPPGPPPSVKGGSASRAAGRPEPQKLGAEGSDSASKSHFDRFERGAAQGARTGAPAQATGPQAQVNVNRAQFGSLDLARLAEDFAAYMVNNPKASRSKRAKEFARRALKKNAKLAKLLAAMGDEAAEQMFDAVGDALEGSPVLGQALDDVSDEVVRNGKKGG